MFQRIELFEKKWEYNEIKNFESRSSIIVLSIKDIQEPLSDKKKVQAVLIELML